MRTVEELDPQRRPGVAPRDWAGVLTAAARTAGRSRRWVEVGRWDARSGPSRARKQMREQGVGDGWEMETRRDVLQGGQVKWGLWVRKAKGTRT